jgi:hypothetical protein
MKYQVVGNNMLELSTIQKKILETFFEKRDTTIIHPDIKFTEESKKMVARTTAKIKNSDCESYEQQTYGVFEGFKAMIRGLTSYDLQKHGILRRTWDINKEFLIKNQLIHLIRERKTGQQTRQFYDITSLGIFWLLQNQDIDSLKHDFLRKYSSHTILTEKRWKDMKKLFGEYLFYILKRSVEQISWEDTLPPGVIKKYPRDKKMIKDTLSKLEEFVKRRKEWYKEYDEIISAIHDADINNSKPLEKICSRYFDLLQKKDAHDKCIIVFMINDYFDELSKPYERFSHQNRMVVLEKTIFWFESIEITLRRQYTKFADTKKGIQSRLERNEKRENISMVLPKNMDHIDFREPDNNVLKRLVFVFYHNLLQMAHDDWTRLDIAQSIWYDIKSAGKTREETKELFQKEYNQYKKGLEKFNYFADMDDQKYDISKKLMTASEDARDIIAKDSELKEIINDGVTEINSEITKLKDMKMQMNIS